MDIPAGWNYVVLLGLQALDLPKVIQNPPSTFPTARVAEPLTVFLLQKWPS